jgi:hypothetical protein
MLVKAHKNKKHILRRAAIKIVRDKRIKEGLKEMDELIAIMYYIIYC